MGGQEWIALAGLLTQSLILLSVIAGGIVVFLQHEWDQQRRVQQSIDDATDRQLKSDQLTLDIARNALTMASALKTAQDALSHSATEQTKALRKDIAENTDISRNAFHEANQAKLAIATAMDKVADTTTATNERVRLIEKILPNKDEN